MRLVFKQRLFSWFDSYDIYSQAGEAVYTVKGQLSWGHCLKIFDAAGVELGTVKQKLFTFLPRFDIYQGENLIGSISREWTFFKPVYNIDFNGWRVEGNFLEWDYTIIDTFGKTVAVISKELWNFTDTYVMDIENPNDALMVIMLVLAIDAEKCSRNN